MKSRFMRDMPSWEEYVKAIAARFGNTPYDDLIGDLKRLRQKGSVCEYQEQFKELLNRVDLSEEYAVSCFLSGLKDDIQTGVRMFMQRILQYVVGLTKLEESKIMGNGRGSQKADSYQGSTSRSSMFSNSTSVGSSMFFNLASVGSAYRRPSMRNSTPLLPTPGESQGSSTRKFARTLSIVELDEKCAKELCFWCDERFERAMCAKKKNNGVEMKRKKKRVAKKRKMKKR